MKKSSGFKHIIRQVHLYLGLASGLIVVIVSLSGALYVFEEEGRELTQHKYFYVKQVGTERHSLQVLSDSFRLHHPKEKITAIRFGEQKDAAFIFNTKSRKAISIDPYTGKELGVRNISTDFFSVVLDLHRTLLLGKTGKVIVKWAVLIFFILCISGLVLWWPKQVRFWKKAVKINFRARSWKRVNWDLHSVLGFYALLVLIIISFTGMFFVFDTVKDGVKLLTGQPLAKETKKKMEPRQKGMAAALNESDIADSAYRYMQNNYPGAKETAIVFPADSMAPIRVQMRYDYAIVRKQNTVSVDRYSGKRLKEELYKNYTTYDLVARSNYDFHTGRIRALGMGSKLIYFLAAIIAASLPVTGFLIWWGRKKKR